MPRLGMQRLEKGSRSEYDPAYVALYFNAQSLPRLTSLPHWSSAAP